MLKTCINSWIFRSTWSIIFTSSTAMRIIQLVPYLFKKNYGYIYQVSKMNNPKGFIPWMYQEKYDIQAALTTMVRFCPAHTSWRLVFLARPNEGSICIQATCRPNSSHRRFVSFRATKIEVTQPMSRQQSA